MTDFNQKKTNKLYIWRQNIGQNVRQSDSAMDLDSFLFLGMPEKQFFIGKPLLIGAPATAAW